MDKRYNQTDNYAASSLKCMISKSHFNKDLKSDPNDKKGVHFVLVPMSEEVGSKEVVPSLIDSFVSRAHDANKLDIELFQSITNEAGVRFCYANPIVFEICETFNLCMDLGEVSKPGELVNTSCKSKTDYICWRSYHKNKSHNEEILSSEDTCMSCFCCNN